MLPCRWALGLGAGRTGSLAHQEACAIWADQMHVKNWACLFPLLLTLVERVAGVEMRQERNLIARNGG